jgi:hypothetical protein
MHGFLKKQAGAAWHAAVRVPSIPANDRIRNSATKSTS